jgi:tRNA threonylcarbamoyladenosine biosynthesis protein TsaB
VPDLQVVGSGAQGAVPAGVRAQPAYGVDPRGLWRAALRAVRHAAPADLAGVDVTYLRASYAELGVNRAKKPPTPSPFV